MVLKAGVSRDSSYIARRSGTYVFQSSTRADAVQVAVQVEPQEISRIVARPPGLGWHRPLKPQGIEVELQADGVIGPDVIVEHFREEHGLRAIGTGDGGHVVELRAGGALAQPGTHNIWKAEEFSHRLRLELAAPGG